MRDFIESREVRIKKIILGENSTNVFTKPFSRFRFRQCLELIKFSFEEKRS